MRISLRPNANYLRYTMAQDRKDPDAAVFSRHATEVGVTKEGEAFAAGATTTERPKCIVTGGRPRCRSRSKARRSRCAVRAASVNSTTTPRNT